MGDLGVHNGEAARAFAGTGGSVGNLILFCAVVTVGLLAAFYSWSVTPADAFVWLLRIALPPLALGAIGFASRLLLKNRAPDYLSWLAREGYFDRGGFAFAFRMGKCKRQAYLYVYFQNQYERPCEAEVAIRPSRWFYESLVPLDPIRMRIECGPAACGVARVSFSVPRELQGKRLRFDVGADVAYAHGRGRCLRYALALPAERDADFRWAPLRSGWGMPVRLTLPEGVDEASKESPRSETRIHWIGSDGPLEAWPEDPWPADQ